MSDLLPITDTDKLACVQREVSMRRNVYPRWVQNGKMKQDKADREIAVMMAIVDDYRVKCGRCEVMPQGGYRSAGND